MTAPVGSSVRSVPVALPKLHQTQQSPHPLTTSDQSDNLHTIQEERIEQSSQEDDDSWMDWETRQKEIPILKHIVAGSCAGIMEHVGMFPIDTIKTHMQASGKRLGMRDVAKILYQDEGLFRFWRGAQVMASGCVPAHASYFLAYEHLKMYLNVDNEELNFSSTLLMGSTTTFAHDFFITPADVMKQRMQLCNKLGVVQCFRNILREEGWRGLYRSYPLTVSMNIPFASCVVCCNENLKTIVRPWERNYSYLWYFLCAGISGGVAGLITNPLDVVKTRLQTQEVKPSCKRLQKLWENSRQLKENGKSGPCCDMPNGKHDPHCSFQVRPSRYNDFKSTVKYIYRTEGANAFSKGIMARMSINIPSTALSWGTYELIKSFLIGKNNGGGSD